LTHPDSNAASRLVWRTPSTPPSTMPGVGRPFGIWAAVGTRLGVSVYACTSLGKPSTIASPTRSISGVVALFTLPLAGSENEAITLPCSTQKERGGGALGSEG